MTTPEPKKNPADGEQEPQPSEVSQEPEAGDDGHRALGRAVAALEQKQRGRRWRLLRYAAIAVILVAGVAWWCLFRSPRLRISEETTFVTGPRTAYGERIDYFAAMEETIYPPEMDTDENGYRLLVRAIGPAAGQSNSMGQTKATDQRGTDRRKQTFDALGLDPASEPTVSFQTPYNYLLDTAQQHDLEPQEAIDRYYDRVMEAPWTLDDAPLMADWIESNRDALDLVQEAVAKPVFVIPFTQNSAAKLLFERLGLEELQCTRYYARALQTRAHYRIGTGDIDGAIDDIVACKRLGRHLHRNGLIVASLVGVAIEGVANSIGIAGSKDFPPTQEQLERLRRELASLPPRPDWEATLTSERFFALDATQSMAHGDIAIGALGKAPPGFAATMNVLSCDWNVVMQRINDFYDDLARAPEIIPAEAWLSPRVLLLQSRSEIVADHLWDVFAPAYLAFREALRRLRCTDNMHRISMAMLLYHHDHDVLPPAFTVDADGHPLHSWRVLLLPYLGQRMLYESIRLEEPWDSDHNRQFHKNVAPVYQCPSAPTIGEGETTYTVITGESAAFGPGTGKSLDDFGDELILVSERRRASPWMAPDTDVSLTEASRELNDRDRAGLGSFHPGGLNVGLREGAVDFVPETTPRDALLEWLTGETPHDTDDDAP